MLSNKSILLMVAAMFVSSTSAFAAEASHPTMLAPVTIYPSDKAPAADKNEGSELRTGRSSSHSPIGHMKTAARTMTTSHN